MLGMLGWVCALGILSLSAIISCHQQFYFTKALYRRADDCNLCYENECLTLDEARCDYYVEADSVLNQDEDDEGGVENPAIKKEVDDLMFDLVNKATGLSNNMECIPYVSRYTDCNKENVCLGCRTCGCNSEGKWNCSTEQPCHTQDAPINIDHRVLVMVMEALIDTGKPRLKRSVTEIPENDNVNASTITLEQMSEWLFGVKPLSRQEFVTTDSTSDNVTVTVQENNTATEISTTDTEPPMKSEHTTTKIKTEPPNSADTDYVAFDEVLRSIAVDNKGYNRRKPPLDNDYNNTTFDIDYMLMDEDNVTSDPNLKDDDYAYLVNFMQSDDFNTESTVEGATKVVIDLLETAGRGGASFNVTQDDDINNKDINTIDAFDNTNDIIEYNAANIMKRDVSGITMPSLVPTVTLIVNTTNTTNVNTTDAEETMSLKETVLRPLNKIIKDKIKELEDLKRIQENLLKYVKTDVEEVDNIEKESNLSNTYFSIYNLAMESGLETDLRRANPSGYDKYMFKLKSDIFEVIKDIIGIQKHKNSDIPEDLKLLMHAMKRYVYKNKMAEAKPNPKKAKSKKEKSFRRQMVPNVGRCDYKSFKDCIVQIIEVIDKDMPKYNALSALSPSSRKIMKYIIKTFYVDELAVPGLRVNDPRYNLTNDLQNIGSKWQEMTGNIIGSSPFVTLYRMKLLHYVLTMDISKMNDALALVDFAHSRRMLHTADNVSENVFDRINAGLAAIHNKIQIIIRYFSQKPKPSFKKTHIEDETTNPLQRDTLDARKQKKRSFIKHIRSLLKTSKKDIAELLHRKVPKSEIVKQLARKKLDELSERRYSEYEETMKRWQKNLDLAPRIRRSFFEDFKERMRSIIPKFDFAPRMRRSVIETFKTRIKNIIPKYLRHKVSPRINENKRNATVAATRKADEKKKKRKALQRERKAKKKSSSRTAKATEHVTPKMTKLTTRVVPITTSVKHDHTTINVDRNHKQLETIKHSVL